MTNSQNGWPAYADTSRFVRAVERGFGFWAANEDVAYIFAFCVRYFDDEIEEITQAILDDWSYANRLVRGSSSTVSNHGSATAIDLNSLQHPRGVHNTFTLAERVKMHRLRAMVVDDSGAQVLRLGMDYTTTVDDMHIEINASAARVAQAARNLRKLQEGLDMDEKTLRRIIRSEVVSVLTEEKIVRNQVLDAGDVEGPGWTVAGALSAGDKKTDLQGRTLTAASNGVVALQAATGELFKLNDNISRTLGSLTGVASNILMAVRTLLPTPPAPTKKV